LNNVRVNFNNISYLKIDGAGVGSISSYTISEPSINLNETYSLGRGEESLVFPFFKETNLNLNVELNGLSEGRQASIAITLNPSMDVVSSILTVTENNEPYSYYADDYFLPQGTHRIVGLNELIVKLIRISACPPDDQLNWVSNKVYDEKGIVIGENKSFKDNIGRPIQSQARNFSTQDVVASQRIYDSFGRPAITTLAAPVYSGSFCFKPEFVTASSGQTYDFTKFDIENTSGQVFGEKNNPFAIDNSMKGTLGWYFSNNNTEEPYVAASGFPYSRTEYYSDPLGRPKKISGVGENHKMGSNHETTVFYSQAGFEFEYVYKNSTSGQSDKISKTVTKDADGIEQIKYTDGRGNVRAICYSGINNDCVDIPVRHELGYHKGRSVDIHLPNSPGQELKWFWNNSRSCGDPNFVEIKVVDLIEERELVIGTDYVLTPSRAFDFSVGSYANKTLYLRISYDYTDAYIGPNGAYYTGYQGQQSFTGNFFPSQSFGYKLDYGNWTLNYYDNNGDLIKTIPPEGVDCNGIDPNIEYLSETDWNDYDVIQLTLLMHIVTIIITHLLLRYLLMKQLKLTKLN